MDTGLKKIVLVFVVTLTQISLKSQSTKSFDQIAYAGPSDWKFTDNGTYRTYLDVNHSANTFCIISVYGSFVSSGNTDTDFQTAWQTDVINHFRTNMVPFPKKGNTASGIPYLQDEGVVSNGQSYLFARLLVLNIRGRSQPILFLSSNKDGLHFYKPDLNNFLSSIKVADANSLSNESIDGTKESGNNDVVTATTNFDDGWVAQLKDDYVLLTRNGDKVYLFYPEEFNDENKVNTTEYFYSHQVAKEYTITNVHARSDRFKYVIEGDAIEKSTGKQCYMVMNVVANNGVAKNVLEVAPTLNELMQQIGIDFEKMVTYNRFGVTLQNIDGAWKGGSGTSQSYYDFYSGNYAGASAVVMSNKMKFNSNGTYSAEFKGAYGMVGNMKTYQQKERGSLTVISPWQISTVDHNNNDKTVLYDCWLEAIKGGMLLHLVNHQYTGETFDLVRDNGN